MDGAGHERDGRFEPRVSVIIRSKDRLGELCDLLGRVFAQTYANFEVVVIDSTERAGEDEWARVRAIRDPRLRFLSTPPRGCPAAANAGVLAAQGDILVFIDDDDLPLGREWLWCHVRNFRDPLCLGVNGYHVFPSEHRAAEASMMQRFRRRLLLSHGPFKEPYCFAYDDRRKVGIDYLMGGNSSIRRSAVLLGGGWDEYLDYHDEHSLFLRLNKRKPPGSYLVYDPDARMEIRKNIPGGLDARFSGETRHRVDTLAKYFLWTVGREHPARIWGLAPLFVPYFAALGAVAGYELAADRPVSRLTETLRGLAWSPVALLRHALARPPAPHDGFAEAAAIPADAARRGRKDVDDMGRDKGVTADVAVIGLGYVGVTVAAALADAGVRVLGIEKRREVVATLRRGRCHIFEPGINDVLRRTIGGRLQVAADWPAVLPPVVVVCVSTPANLATRTPDLRNIADTADEIARRLPDDGLVIVRSTVPVGTSRRLVLRRVRRGKPRAGLAFCPERTVQGAALAELRSLPQVIGAIDERSASRAARLFRKLTPDVVVVDKPETAEMVKLVNNCHTDLLYAFGNEVALLARTHGVDPLEVIRGANQRYTVRTDGVAVVRPRIAVPGYVGGGCLSKDPYLLLQSLGGRPARKSLVFAVRELNESMPVRAANELLALLRGAGKKPSAARVLLCGFAYKGRPETDDLRGTPATPFVRALRGRVGRLLGHDYKVAARDVRAFGVRPVALAEGLRRADAVVLLNDHPRYARELTPRRLASAAKRVVVYDSWRILRGTGVPALPGVTYAGLGWTAT